MGLLTHMPAEAEEVKHKPIEAWEEWRQLFDSPDVAATSAQALTLAAGFNDPIGTILISEGNDSHMKRTPVPVAPTSTRVNGGIGVCAATASKESRGGRLA
ncbi:Os04g0301225 [Oryza sativa Japonica Group]|uniref:Os04g0301225 protein n=1 Tax=Oryza sativa subsp. japonica TaxID=39947 RepID=A0A0P0W8D3_ORYSJ|nr:Os04g0301225 [Oryza sativa Japonica Group]